VRGTSARNHLPGEVQGITSVGAVARVEIDCGFPLAVIVTRSALEDLQLTSGSPVTAAIKAGAVHLVPRLDT
jgi:molybdate transport system ATP-binding protein